MNASERTGVALVVTATTMVGSMVAASSLIVDYPVLAGQAGRYALGAAVLAAVVQLTGRRRLPRLSPRELGLVVTSVGFVAWYSGVARLGVERAGLFAGLIPVAALVSVAVVGASEISVTKLAGSLVVGAGIVLGLAGRPRRATPRPSG